jgi:transcriptional repressor of dcmA and dcmR
MSRTDKLVAEPLWTLEDVAAFLRVSTATVRRWTNTGALPCYRVGGNRERRFSRQDVVTFIQAHRQ